MSPTTDIRTVLIVGGSDGLGAWLLQHVWLADDLFEVAMADIALPSESPRGYTFHHIDYTADGVRGLPDLSDFDLVVICVPIPEIARVAAAILPGIRPGALVLDIASVKQRPMEAIERALPPGVGYIGTHPLFGKAVPSLIGQTVVMCESPRTMPEQFAWLRELLRRHGGTVHEMTPLEHDRAMAVVQVLTHFTALTVAFTLEREGADFRRALDLLTPPFRALAGVVGRVIDIPEVDPEEPGERGARLLVDIQLADYADAQRIRDGFEHSVRRLNELARSGEREALTLAIERVAEYFSQETLEECKQLFARSHATAQRAAHHLYLRRVRGDLCAFRSTVHGRVVVGRVVDFTATTISLEVCSTRPGERDTTHKSRERDADGRPVLYVLAFDDESRAAAAKLGFKIPSGRVESLPRGDYDLLSDSEFEAWKVEWVMPFRRDVTFVMPDGVDVERIAGLVPQLADGILSSEVLSTYEPPDGSPLRCTMRLKIRGDFVPDRVVECLTADLSAFAMAALR